MVSSAGLAASVLQKAEVRIINSTVCKSLMDDQVTDRMLCAGVLKGGVDACQVTLVTQQHYFRMHVPRGPHADTT